MDESWCRHLSRLDLLKEEMVLQSFTAERFVYMCYLAVVGSVFYDVQFNRRNKTIVHEHSHVISLSLTIPLLLLLLMKRLDRVVSCVET